MATRPDIKQIREASPGAAMLERMRKGKEAFRVLRWPGADDSEQPFALVPLTCDELQDAYAGAYRRFEEIKLPITMYTADDFHSETNMQVLLRAMVLLDDSKPPRPTSEQLFTDADEFRKLLGPEERNALSDEYLQLQNEVDPDPSEMSQELLDKLDDLVKKKDVAALSATSSVMLASYIIGTADRSLS